MGWFGRNKQDRRGGESGRINGPDLDSGSDHFDKKRVQILLDTIADLISTVGHSEVLRSIVDNAIGAVGAERGILFLAEQGDPERLRVEVARDAYGNDLPQPIQYSTTVVRKVATDGEPMCWKVSSQDGVQDLSQSIVDMKLRAVMCVTLRVKERRLGVIYVDSRATHREFSRSDLRFFDALAGALSIAVENARLVRETIANERVKEQVKIAREIQCGLLPDDPRGVPGFELAGWSQAAEEALGDYYDFIELKDGRIGVAIGDVAGHGIGPALLMSSARSLLRSLTAGPFDLADVLSRMNDQFEADTRGAIFMSLFFGVLDPRQRTLTFGNAGHTAPLLLRADGSALDLKRTGLALGIERGVEYGVPAPIGFVPGDVLLLTTDGIIEARAGEEFFGRERLRRAVAHAAGQPPKELLRTIYRDVLEFTGGMPPDDDLTMVLVRATA